MDEDVNEMEGKTSEEIEEKLKEKEAKANAQILELVSCGSCSAKCTSITGTNVS